MKSVLILTILSTMSLIIIFLGLLTANEYFNYQSLYELKEPIDMVYTWVDGDDKDWLAQKNLHSGVKLKDSDTANRFKNRDEIKYSLRSVEMFAPWIRNIYIITYKENSYPPWLNLSNDKVKIISHSEIFPNKSHLPTFNSQAIECHICNIKGLSEYFIYSNDDTMFGNFVNKQDFISKDGNIKYGYGKGVISSWKHPKYNGLFFDSWINNSKLLDDTFGEDNGRIETPHQLCMLNKESLDFVAKNFPEEVNNTSRSRFRGEDNIAPVGLGIFCSLARDKAERCKISNIVLKLTDSVAKTKSQMRSIKGSRPKLLCVNDDTEDPSSELDATVSEFLEEYFPVKSSFEI